MNQFLDAFGFCGIRARVTAIASSGNKQPALSIAGPNTVTAVSYPGLHKVGTYLTTHRDQ